MSDFVSSFWGLAILVVSVVSVIACAVLLKSQSVVRKAEGLVETTGHLWDEDLSEYNNPLPRWWASMFYITIVFGLAYLVLYPGTGLFGGVFGWTQTGEYERERAAAEAVYGPLYDRYLKQDLPTVAADAQARGMGLRIFLNNCAQCHGSDAGGAKGFPNLRDADWLYGGEPEQIKTSITDGRDGVMPPLGPALGEEGVKNVVQFVRSLSGQKHDAKAAAAGKEIFATFCAACHGPDGAGMQALGAPKLTDQIWLFGGSEQAIAETIMKGRGGNALVPGQTRMPAHKGLLSEGKIHLVAAYVWGLSQDPTGGVPKAQ
ncbi:MAG: cytochrome-c oxidase, cbb3-type subunit III [Betaproteobacteria bacterium]|nr:cytochrome-c oxidase, cbb3-type subunit III [Betaproteobacteria bacterium]